MSAAQRQRRRRARIRQGEAVFKIAAPHDPLVEYLIATDRLSEDAALNHASVEQATGQVLCDLIERWKQTVTRDF